MNHSLYVSVVCNYCVMTMIGKEIIKKKNTKQNLAFYNKYFYMAPVVNSNRFLFPYPLVLCHHKAPCSLRSRRFQQAKSDFWPREKIAFRSLETANTISGYSIRCTKRKLLYSISFGLKVSTPGNIWWGCAARVPKPSPYFRLKHDNVR